MNENINNIINSFTLHRESHPNLSSCWLSYINYKKNNFDINHKLIEHCNHVLQCIDNGVIDYSMRDIINIFIFKNTFL
jgi:hypothetical protein